MISLCSCCLYVHIQWEETDRKGRQPLCERRRSADVRRSGFSSGHRTWCQPLTLPFFVGSTEHSESGDPTGPQSPVTWPWHPHLHNIVPCLCSDWAPNKDLCLCAFPPTAVHDRVLPLSVRLWLLYWLTQQIPTWVAGRQRDCVADVSFRETERETNISIWRKFVSTKDNLVYIIHYF